MDARIFHLPVTPAGRRLLRDCLFVITDWRWPNGDPIDDDDFDEQAAEIDRLMRSAPRVEVQK
jgi:hypothetical protein